MGPRLRLEFSVYVAFTNFFVVDGYELSERHGRIFRRARVGAGSALRCATRAPRAVVHGDRGLLLQWSWKRHGLLSLLRPRQAAACTLPARSHPRARALRYACAASANCSCSCLYIICACGHLRRGGQDAGGSAVKRQSGVGVSLMDQWRRGLQRRGFASAERGGGGGRRAVAPRRSC